MSYACFFYISIMNSSSDSDRTVHVLSVHSNTSDRPSVLFLLPWRYFWSFLFSCPNLDWRIYRPAAQLLTLTSFRHHFDKSLSLSCVGLPVTWILSLLSCCLPCLNGVHPSEAFEKGCVGSKYIFRSLHVQNILYSTHTLVYSLAGHMFS